MKPTFSICIPNYNYARYIGTTIESVLSQSYPHFEIIVADNASTDDSVEVVRSFGSKKIRVIENQRNIGFAPNLDRATESAKNDFMILLSSDDVMRPGALETYAKVLTDLGSDAANAVLTSAVDVVDGEGSLTGVSYRPQGDLFYRTVSPEAAEAMEWAGLPVERERGLAALKETLRRKDSPAQFLATCYSRQLYERVEGYRSLYRMWPDSDFLNKLLAEDPIFVYVPQRLFAYRVHQNNQLAGEASSGALKYQVDAYMHTVEFPETLLTQMGLRRDELVDVFVEKAVMERGLQAMAVGNAERAFRCLAFGFATYPKKALVEPKTYALAGLLALGPVGRVAAKNLYTWHTQRKRRGASSSS